MGTRDPKCSTPGCRFLAVSDQDVCIRQNLPLLNKNHSVNRS